MINYSIIIPHYNIPDLLGRCLRSIPQREDVQVIVVDDNSPGNEDYTHKIPELKRNGIEFYVATSGKGAGHARNIGLEHAVGKWLIFADSDDFFVEDVSSILDEYANNENDIIYFNIFSCDCYDTNKRYPSKKDRLFSLYEKSNNDMIFRVGCVDPWGKIIRRQLVLDNNIRFQETRAHNDLLFSVMTGIKAQSVGIVNRPIYWYVIREGSLGHQKGIEPIVKIKDRILAYKKTQEFLEVEHVKLKMYIPAIPIIRVLKKKISMFPKLMIVSKELGCNTVHILYGILLYILRKSFTGKGGLGLDEQLMCN